MKRHNKKLKNKGSSVAGVDKESDKMTIETENFIPLMKKKTDSVVKKKTDSVVKKKTDSAVIHSVDPKKSSSDGKKKKLREKKKKPRLIVRNLPYRTTEASVREHFEQFGEVTDVVLLRKPDQKLVGCGFVQFLKKQNAAKAIAHASGRPFDGRPIVVDWAVPKDEYVKKTRGHEHDEDIKPEIKEEKEEEDDDSSSELGESNKHTEVDLENESGDDIHDDKDDDEDDEDDDDDDSDDSEADSVDNKKFKKEKLAGNIKREQKERFESHDVTEGRTVFLRNLPFAVDNDRLREFGRQFGCVLYAVVCMDPNSDHSRGMGFIKFKDTESVKQCISQAQNKELVLDNRTIDASLALSREDAKKGKSEKVKKDNRNLYLLKEGLITAGSSAAEGVSPSDMEKRIALEQWKTKTLRDLTKFVSRLRLAIHNLPPSFTDEQLRTLAMKHGGFKPRLTEARIMRNLRDVDANGVGRSKEYGFVAFTNHENALEALRNLNNNPNIFGPNKRPIVAFSIEDKKMLNIRKRRQERSLMKNPTWKHYKKEEESEPKKKKQLKGNQKTAEKSTGGQKPQFGKQRKNSATESSASKEKKPFMGAVSKEGEGQTIPLRKLRYQAELVRKKARMEKKKSRQNNKPERIKQPKQPKKQNEGTDNFNKMVDKYKSALAGAPASRSKWYD